MVTWLYVIFIEIVSVNVKSDAMLNKKYSRREFVKKNSLTGLSAMIGIGATPSVLASFTNDGDTPAILGGKPVHTSGWPKWPQWNP